MYWSGIIIHADAVVMHYLITSVMFKEKFETLYTVLSFTEGIQYFFLGLMCCQDEEGAGSDFFSFFNFWHRFVTDLKNTHPRSEGDELEHALKGEAHGEGEVHVGEEVPQHERRSVKLNTGKDKTRMKKGLKCVRNYCCFSWAVDIDRKAIEFDKLTCGPISRPRLLDAKWRFWLFSEELFLKLFWGQFFWNWKGSAVNTQFQLSSFTMTVHQYKTGEAELKDLKASVFSPFECLGGLNEAGT